MKPLVGEEEHEEVHAPNGGLVDTRTLDLLRGSESRYLLNCHHNRLGLEKRLGRVQIGDVILAPDLDCFAGLQFVRKDQTYQELRVNGTNLYKLDGANWKGAVSGQNPATAADLFGGGEEFGSWAVYNDRAFYFDGSDTRKYWDGTSIKTLGVFSGDTLPKGTIEGSISTGGFLLQNQHYRFVYTYYNPTTGEESNPSEPSEEIILPAGTNTNRFSIRIPAFSQWDEEFTTVRVYRTAGYTGTPGAYYFDFEVAGLDRCDILEHYIGMCQQADSGLTTEVEYDNGQVPGVRFVVLFNNRFVGAGIDDDPCSLRWSKESQAWSWPPANAQEIDDNGDPINGLFVLFGRLYVIKKTGGVYMLQPKSNAAGEMIGWDVSPITSDWGCISHFGITIVDNSAYWQDTKGWCRCNGQQVEGISDPKIRQRWKGLAAGANIVNVYGVHDRRADHQYVRLRVVDPSDSNIVYHLIYDVSLNVWLQDRAATANTGRGDRVLWRFRDASGQYWVYTGDNTGRCFRLASNTSGTAVYDDAGQAIDMVWKSRWYGGLDHFLPLYLDIEMERSDDNQILGELEVHLYRDSSETEESTEQKFPLWDSASVRVGENSPDGAEQSFIVRAIWADAHSRRFSFGFTNYDLGSDVRIVQFRLVYKTLGKMYRK